jgi:hypothetical protein
LVVFVDSKKNTIDLAIFAKDNFPGEFKDGKFGAMHSLLSSQERTLLNSDFAAGIILVMFCTSILEMGIDKHNLDAIVNIGPLHSIESFLQRAGRAGRRGQKTKILTLYKETTASYKANGDEKELVVALRYSVRLLLATTSCRRKFLLHYIEDREEKDNVAPVALDDSSSASSSCCDNCASDVLTVECGFEVAWLLEMLHRHSGRRPPNLPLLVKMLMGGINKEVREITSSDYHSEILGVGKHKSARWWNDFILGPVYAANMITQIVGRSDSFMLTTTGEQFRRTHVIDLKVQADKFPPCFVCKPNVGMMERETKKRIAPVLSSRQKKCVAACCEERDRRAETAGLGSYDFLPDLYIREGVVAGLAVPSVSRLSAISSKLESNYFDSQLDAKTSFAEFIFTTLVDSDTHTCEYFQPRKKELSHLGSLYLCTRRSWLQHPHRPATRTCKLPHERAHGPHRVSKPDREANRRYWARSFALA